MIGLFASILAQLNYALYEAGNSYLQFFLSYCWWRHNISMTGFDSFNAAILFLGFILTSVWVYGFLIYIIIEYSSTLYRRVW